MDPQKSDHQTTYESKEELVTEHGSKTLSNIESDTEERIPYPKRVFFIIGNEFCERFNYYGLRSLLTNYINETLGFSTVDATAIYHGFSMAVYFTGVFGGIISDSWLGKFRTILYLSIVYVMGSIIVAIGAIPASPIIVFIGLFCIAVGSGGIKPCVAAFGGDQFTLPQQAKYVAQYFSLFYFSINSGSLISSYLTPVLKENVQCFGSKDCYPLAYEVPALLMIVALVLFLIGRKSYTYAKMPSHNMIVRVAQVISHAISTKFRRTDSTEKCENLLDYSIEKYGEQTVADTRALLRILVLYLPLPFFWALYEQQASKWLFQVKRMNGDLGFTKILPEQVQSINPFLVLTFIPVFEAAVYPILARIGIRKPLQKLFIGGILAGVAFIVSAFVALRIEAVGDGELSVLWIIPQYIVMTMAEVMFSVTGLAFSYDQAPESMKSVVQACWQLTVAFGHLIIIFIEEARIFEQQSKEFFLFAGLMFIDMSVFAILALNYEIGIGNVFDMIKKKFRNK